MSGTTTDLGNQPVVASADIPTTKIPALNAAGTVVLFTGDTLVAAVVAEVPGATPPDGTSIETANGKLSAVFGTVAGAVAEGSDMVSRDADVLAAATAAAPGLAPVQSVAGRDGAVTLTEADIEGLGGAAVLNVGTVTGTVADGGLVAALTAQLAALTPPALDYSSEYNSAYI